MSIDLTSLPENLSYNLGLELEPREQICWLEQPTAWRWACARAGKACRAFPMMFFMGILTAWAASAARADGGILAQALTVLFSVICLASLWDVLGPLRAIREARHSAYVITDQRALLCESDFFGRLTIRSFSPASLDKMTATERSNGSGDLVFYRTLEEDYTHRKHTNSRVWEGKQHPVAVGFLGIRNAKNVEQLLTQLIQSAPPPPQGFPEENPDEDES